MTAAGFACGAAGPAVLAAATATGLPFAYGLLPGLLLLPAGVALAFAGAAVLGTTDVPPDLAGLAGGVLNTAMESGATVLFAALLALGGGTAPLAAAALAFATMTAVTARPAPRGISRQVRASVRVFRGGGSSDRSGR
ncbi:hypothetical protein [Streptomyces sp. NPDC097619]|uniref:hypothetical protein n=1 Tax=Streptomyces sp. NPDC097619 TaxID=3157228 RepID=UPI0033194356